MVMTCQSFTIFIITNWFDIQRKPDIVNENETNKTIKMGWK
jgi:hypothetical protein